MTEIPLTSELPNYTQETPLGGGVYQISPAWNGRSGTWYAALSRDGERLLAGRRVLVDASLIGRFKDGRLPGGALVPLDLDASRVDPGREDLGGRVTVVHITAEEVAAGEVSA